MTALALLAVAASGAPAAAQEMDESYQPGQSEYGNITDVELVASRQDGPPTLVLLTEKGKLLPASGIYRTRDRKALVVKDGRILELSYPAADGSTARTGSGGAVAVGSATLTVAGETYEFDRVRCAFGPEETRRDDTELVLSARQNGMQLDATFNTRFGHVVSLDDIEDHENPRVAWSAGEPGSATAGSEEIIHVDGKRVSVETTFTDQTTGTTANGTLEATCP